MKHYDDPPRSGHLSNRLVVRSVVREEDSRRLVSHGVRLDRKRLLNRRSRACTVCRGGEEEGVGGIVRKTSPSVGGRRGVAARSWFTALRLVASILRWAACVGGTHRARRI
eukprot:CAMPEP_0182951468 /NCGR_PEP_ID=MMETSP0105_2-20130417/61288_1 /TAXON_ID=81532 ORGANISM="Acanthoeca-like sp., Strain 10tr" /NCGR_SAMPLE_ID=MMETSP0105_2 /ASSEMBLY_ACC=CAM_ASM_000205 /LENGTH=110 /DNA_ID=CAMNT_0025091783 /DNA_START=623 /DNA_END=952 /DNA_ORIENTATION=+